MGNNFASPFILDKGCYRSSGLFSDSSGKDIPGRFLLQKANDMAFLVYEVEDLTFGIVAFLTGKRKKICNNYLNFIANIQIFGIKYRTTSVSAHAYY